MTIDSDNGQVRIVDTYAEAFRSLYAEVIITARDRKWLDRAVAACCGNASSTIMCDCEAGRDRYVGPGSNEDSPDGRPGAVIQFHLPRFRKDRVEALQQSLLTRISQNVLTCPTTACFGDQETDDYFKLGKKISFFGDGYQKRVRRDGRDQWSIPILGGEFLLDRRFGYRDGIMGGNLWFMGATVDAATEAAEAAADAVGTVPGTITTFPGGVAASGSKAGSRYSFLIASTYAEFCPTLRETLGEQSRVPEGVESIMEIIVNGKDLVSIQAATAAAIHAALPTPGLMRISAGNYGGRLGKSFIHLRDLPLPDQALFVPEQVS
jgi:formylmethanofuran--tetrahydromethanopterin N-formyltransferase